MVCEAYGGGTVDTDIVLGQVRAPAARGVLLVAELADYFRDAIVLE